MTILLKLPRQLNENDIVKSQLKQTKLELNTVKNKLIMCDQSLMKQH